MLQEENFPLFYSRLHSLFSYSIRLLIYLKISVAKVPNSYKTKRNISDKKENKTDKAPIYRGFRLFFHK